jgi:hypothetical protein
MAPFVKGGIPATWEYVVIRQLFRFIAVFDGLVKNKENPFAVSVLKK